MNKLSRIVWEVRERQRSAVRFKPEQIAFLTVPSVVSRACIVEKISIRLKVGDRGTMSG